MKRRIIAIVAALVVACVGAGAVVAYASSADERAVAGQAVQMAYIAKAEVPLGTTLKQAAAAHLIGPERVVAKGVPRGALTEVSQQSSEVALSNIQPGSIVLKSSFGVPSKARVRTTVVPKGKVAITVSLADPERVAPLLDPGAHVVIYDTYSPNGTDTASASPSSSSGSSQTTHVLLPDAEVVAVGSDVMANGTAAQGTTNKGKDGASPDAQTASGALVTVAVTPKDAIALVHGIRTGTLYAGLLGTDVKVDRGDNVTAQTLFEK